MSDPFLMRLTQPELLLLLQALELETLPGLTSDLLAGLDDGQRTMALRVADQTLRARRYVGWSSHTQHVVNPALADLLFDYADPIATLFVDTALPTGRAMPFLYVFGTQRIYEQCQPEPDVLQFRVLPSSGELEQRLIPRLVETQVSQPERWQGQISQRLLLDLLQRIRKNDVFVRQVFEAVLPSELAQALAAAYTTPQVIQYLACWTPVPDTEHPEPQASLTLVQGETHAFVLWTNRAKTQQEDAFVHVSLFSAATVRHYIKSLLSYCVRAHVPTVTPIQQQ